MAKEELSKLNEDIAREMQEIKKAWNKKGQDGSQKPSGKMWKRGKKSGQVNEFTAEEEHRQTTLVSGGPAAKGPN